MMDGLVWFNGLSLLLVVAALGGLMLAWLDKVVSRDE